MFELEKSFLTSIYQSYFLQLPLLLL